MTFDTLDPYLVMLFGNLHAPRRAANDDVTVAANDNGQVMF